MAPEKSLHESTEETSLDMLENEDRRLVKIAEEVDAKRGTSVEDRADYGNEAKLLVRHVAAREAALMDVVDGLSGVAGAEGLRDRLLGDPARRRARMNTVEKMSRGVQGMYLNTGQDFDGALSTLFELLRPSLEWELREGIDEVRRCVGDRGAELFHSAGHVARHAPTSLHPTGPKWWERAPVVSRVVTAVQHLRDYPRATRDART